MTCSHCGNPATTYASRVSCSRPLCADCSAALDADLAALEVALASRRAAKIAVLRASDAFDECHKFWTEFAK